MDMLCAVPFVGDHNQESWRLLVKELIAKIAKQRTPFLGRFPKKLGFEMFVFLGAVLLNQPSPA